MGTVALLSLLPGIWYSRAPIDVPQAAPEAFVRLAQPVRLAARGRPVAGALVESIASQAGFPAALGSAVPDSVHVRRLVFEADHLNGYEALACLARVLGLEVIVLPEGAVLASPERMPSGWRAMAAAQHRYWHERRQASEDRWERRLARRADLRLADVTLAAALRHVRTAYGVDVLASEAVWEGQKLVSLEVTNTALSETLGRLARQFGVVVRCRDGAAWLEHGVAAAGRQPADASNSVSVVVPAAVRRRVSRPVGSRLDRVVCLDAERRTVGETLVAAAEQAAVTIHGFSVAEGEAGRPEVSAAAGPLGDVLEAARMIWRKRWWVEERPVADGSTLMLTSPAGE